MSGPPSKRRKIQKPQNVQENTEIASSSALNSAVRTSNRLIL
jgi:hypothetical protein